MDVIRSISHEAGRGERMDDVAAVPSRGKRLVVKVDMLVEGTDMPPAMSYRQAARKAVAACVSDFAAKGVRPDSFLVSLGLRRGTTEEQVRELGQGFREAEDEWKVRLVGGDTNEAKELVIDCAMFGFGGRALGRDGASAGEVLVTTGLYGSTAGGLKILTGGAKAGKDFYRKAVQAVLHPAINLDAGMALSKYLTASVDSSDGLARSLHILARESRVGFEVSELPEDEGVGEFAEKNGFAPADLVLFGGEEYLVVGTLKKGRLASAREAVRRAGGDLVAMGRATASAGEVRLRKGASTRKIEDRGWTHLT